MRSAAYAAILAAALGAAAAGVFSCNYFKQQNKAERRNVPYAILYDNTCDGFYEGMIVHDTDGTEYDRRFERELDKVRALIEAKNSMESSLGLHMGDVDIVEDACVQRSARPPST